MKRREIMDQESIRESILPSAPVEELFSTPRTCEQSLAQTPSPLWSFLPVQSMSPLPRSPFPNKVSHLSYHASSGVTRSTIDEGDLTVVQDETVAGNQCQLTTSGIERIRRIGDGIFQHSDFVDKRTLNISAVQNYGPEKPINIRDESQILKTETTKRSIQKAVIKKVSGLPLKSLEAKNVHYSQQYSSKSNHDSPKRPIKLSSHLNEIENIFGAGQESTGEDLQADWNDDKIFQDILEIKFNLAFNSGAQDFPIVDPITTEEEDSKVAVLSLTTSKAQHKGCNQQDSLLLNHGGLEKPRNLHSNFNGANYCAGQESTTEDIQNVFKNNKPSQELSHNMKFNLHLKPTELFPIASQNIAEAQDLQIPISPGNTSEIQHCQFNLQHIPRFNHDNLKMPRYPFSTSNNIEDVYEVRKEGTAEEFEDKKNENMKFRDFLEMNENLGYKSTPSFQTADIINIELGKGFSSLVANVIMPVECTGRIEKTSTVITPTSSNYPIKFKLASSNAEGESISQILPSPKKAKENLGINKSFIHYRESTRNGIYLHIPELKSFECTVCHNSYENKYCLRRHTAVHHVGLSINEKDNKRQKKRKRNIKEICGICHQSFFRANMPNHIKVVHEKPAMFNCIICNAGFSTSRSFSNHNRVLHGERAKRKYNVRKPVSCDFEGCSHVSSSNSNAKRHKTLVHWKDRKFQCENCKRNFGTKAQLYIHKCLDRPLALSEGKRSK